LRLFSFGGYGLALAALALMVFGAYDSYPYVQPHQWLSQSYRDLLDYRLNLILKNNQNTFPSSFYTQNRYELSKTLVSILLCTLTFQSKDKTPVLGKALPFLGVKPKREWYVFWLFFRIGLCSAISFKRSRRELSIDGAEHTSIMKKY